MSTLSRRQFLGKSVLGLGSVFAAARIPLNYTSPGSKSVKMPIGFQSWIVREKIGTDFEGTLKMVAAMGYESIEMCSPVGYESLGFGGLLKYKPAELKKIINDSGLKWTSTHYGMDEFRKNLGDRIAFAAESGQKQMVLSSFGIEENATLSDWQRAADELNAMGAKSKQAGIQMGYHNHDMEFEKLDGSLIYDALMSEFDRDLIKMQFQVAVISKGFKASTYFKKYPGRFISAHLADWSDTEKKNVPIGKGIVDWKEFFSEANTAGLKNIFVEMNLETFKDSVDFLHKL
jgi:sugar phosphate isomerase/epimerase